MYTVFREGKETFIGALVYCIEGESQGCLYVMGVRDDIEIQSSCASVYSSACLCLLYIL